MALLDTFAHTELGTSSRIGDNPAPAVADGAYGRGGADGGTGGAG